MRTEPRKACCLVSEVLEEAGLDRAKARQLRRQVLEGLILLCRWQLERMEEGPRAPRQRKAGARKVTVE
jgi:predicted aminopeptidase